MHTHTHTHTHTHATHSRFVACISLCMTEPFMTHIYTIFVVFLQLPLLDESVAERYWHSVSTLQLGPHCVWLILFGGWYFRADTVIIEISEYNVLLCVHAV